MGIPKTAPGIAFGKQRSTSTWESTVESGETRMKHGSAIALVEFNWIGHHPTYFKLIVRALLEIGCTELALCPEPGEVGLSTDDVGPDAKSRLALCYVSWASAIPGVPSRIERRPKTLRLTLQI